VASKIHLSIKHPSVVMGFIFHRAFLNNFYFVWHKSRGRFYAVTSVNSVCYSVRCLASLPDGCIYRAISKLSVPLAICCLCETEADFCVRCTMCIRECEPLLPHKLAFCLPLKSSDFIMLQVWANQGYRSPDRGGNLLPSADNMPC